MLILGITNALLNLINNQSDFNQCFLFAKDVINKIKIN